MEERTCIQDDCDQPRRVRGLCERHYSKARWAGNIDEVGLPRHPSRGGGKIANPVTDVDTEARTCTCHIHGPGSRLRVRLRKAGRVVYLCRQCDRGPGDHRGGKGVSSVEARRAAYLRSKYGMTVEEYEIRIQAQQGMCLICRAEIDESNGAVDHCHNLGHVRGILCRRCNIGLGWFNDDPELVARATKYLVRNQRAAG